MKFYEDLANAIIMQAVTDYRKALKALSKYSNDSDAKRTKAECERFFRSDWYRMLTSIDGEMLISKLQAEVSA